MRNKEGGGLRVVERRRHPGLGNGLQPITDFTEHLNSELLNLFFSPLTFLEAVPEGARSAHRTSLLVERHARVSQSVVAARVK